jgi:hypothetical protein
MIDTTLELFSKLMIIDVAEVTSKLSFIIVAYISSNAQLF